MRKLVRRRLARSVLGLLLAWSGAQAARAQQDTGLDSDSLEMLQVGNCGPPIETDQGWLVLTHGVGPMRVYVIGALLLDLDDPTRVVGYSRTPLLSPGPDERDGYVPNVLYSCGAFLHDGLVWIPYGIDDCRIGVAYAPLDEVLADMRSASYTRR